MAAVEAELPELDEGCCLKWRPTSPAALAKAETQMLSYLKTKYRGFFVNIGNLVGNKENKIRSIVLNETSDKVPLVLVHGFGAAIGLWILNLDSLASQRPVYAFDVLGFGRSSRPKFSTDAQEAEAQFVESIEHWRAQVNLDKMILLGHSLGGFLAAAYALRHPNHVEHLILADMWGGGPQQREIPFWLRTAVALFQSFNPLASLRVAGPIGPYLINKLRPDLKKKFEAVVEEENDAVFDYIYHCNAQAPSGEAAFKAMNTNFGWAKDPIMPRLTKLSSTVSLTFIYGSESWIDKEPGFKLKEARPCVDIKVISGAGHHVYADHPSDFNDILNEVGGNVDEIRSTSTNLNSIDSTNQN